MNEPTMFETLLASTVHDMKNSLSLLLNQLDHISEQLAREAQNEAAVADLRYQATRINVSLMELLALYKLEKQQIGIHYNEVFLVDFLEDCIAAHSPLAGSRGLALELACDDDLMWFFDPDLVGIAISNIIGNCLNYTHSRVLVSAVIRDGMLEIRVEDDGEGYPRAMLSAAGQSGGEVNFNTGSTGLGLYFARTIAERHQRSERQGGIGLRNKGQPGGGIFTILLP